MRMSGQSCLCAASPLDLYRIYLWDALVDVFLSERLQPGSMCVKDRQADGGHHRSPLTISPALCTTRTCWRD